MAHFGRKTLISFLVLAVWVGAFAFAGEKDKREKVKTTAEIKQEATSIAQDSENRVKAIRQLAGISDARLIRDEAIVETLINLLEKDRDLRVRQAAVEALARIQTNATSADDWAKNRYVVPFMNILKDKNEYFPLRKTVAGSLGQTLRRGNLKDEKAFDELLEIAKDKLESVPVRIQAVRVLGSFGSPKAFDVLSDLIAATDIDLQTASAEAFSDLLERVSDASQLSFGTVSRLMNLAKDKTRPASLRANIIDAMARLYRQGNRDAISALNVIIELLEKEENEDVLIAAVRGAGTAGDAKVIPALGKVYSAFRKLPANFTGDKAQGAARQAKVRRGVMQSLKSILQAQISTNRPSEDVGRQVMNLLLLAVNDEEETSEVKDSAIFSLYYLYDKAFKNLHKQAVLALRGLMEVKGSESLVGNMAETLQVLTGRDYGEDMARWKEYIDKTYPQ